MRSADKGSRREDDSSWSESEAVNDTLNLILYHAYRPDAETLRKPAEDYRTADDQSQHNSSSAIYSNKGEAHVAKRLLLLCSGRRIVTPLRYSLTISQLQKFPSSPILGIQTHNRHHHLELVSRPCEAFGSQR